MSEKKGGVNYSIIIIAILFSVALATGASYFMFTKLGGMNSKEAIITDSKELGPTVDIGQFLSNLSDGRRFIKVNVTLEISDDKVSKEIDERSPQIRDAIITILRSKDNQEINQDQGIRKLRTEIMNKINNNLMSGKVTNVFFTDFVVQ